MLKRVRQSECAIWVGFENWAVCSVLTVCVTCVHFRSFRYKNMLEYWNSTNNNLDQGDFGIYSTYEDALANENVWM